MTYFIGVAGPKGVGKDTFSTGLARAMIVMNHIATIGRLADPLYNAVSWLTGLSLPTLMNQRLKEKVWTKEDAPFPALVGKCIRDMLIDIGEDMRNRYGEDVFVKALKARAKSTEEQPEFVIVTDVRTDPEAKEMDLTILLSREGITYKGGKTESPLSVDVLKWTLDNLPGNPEHGSRYSDVMDLIENRLTTLR